MSGRTITIRGGDNVRSFKRHHCFLKRISRFLDISSKRFAFYSSSAAACAGDDFLPLIKSITDEHVLYVLYIPKFSYGKFYFSIVCVYVATTNFPYMIIFLLP